MDNVVIEYEVTTETASYGPECTVEMAQECARIIERRVLDYADDMGYDVTVYLRSHVRGVNPYAGWGDPEESAWEDVNSYVEANWVDWIGQVEDGE
jgi:hypothetical protein